MQVPISTTALVVGLFVSAIITIIAAGIISIKRERRRAEARMRAYLARRELYPQHNAMTRDGHWPAAPETSAVQAITPMTISKEISSFNG